MAASWAKENQKGLAVKREETRYKTADGCWRGTVGMVVWVEGVDEVQRQQNIAWRLRHHYNKCDYIGQWWYMRVLSKTS
jgi:hypothetical protein